MLHGIINVKKEKDYTSHDVVAKLRGILHQRQIGHTGTLDPNATGVLPVCLGHATKLCEMFTDKSKTYIATMRLGMVTDTQDTTGTVTGGTDAMPQEEMLRTVIESFVGKQMQLPPMYSAKKVNGKKLYEWARQGIEIERERAEVHFYKIEIRSVALPLVQLEVSCSPGTYIRTLCHDIGEVLGCGACMQDLVRTQVGPFLLEHSYTLDEIRDKMESQTLEPFILKVEEVFAEYPAVICPRELDVRLYNGNPLPSMLSAVRYDGWIRVYDSAENFKGIYQFAADKQLYYPVKMFL
ncbi:MAG: tRNA pseudouridine(55) synthase TruB [Lachnospiraceae bacterium]